MSGGWSCALAIVELMTRSLETVMIITRAAVGRVLVDWESGRLSAAQVHEWAEHRYAVAGCEPEDDIVTEVLARLDTLDLNLTVADDAPALLRLLETALPQLSRALHDYEQDARDLDLEARKRALRDDPFYAPYCAADSSS